MTTLIAILIAVLALYGALRLLLDLFGAESVKPDGDVLFNAPRTVTPADRLSQFRQRHAFHESSANGYPWRFRNLSES